MCKDKCHVYNAIKAKLTSKHQTILLLDCSYRINYKFKHMNMTPIFKINFKDFYFSIIHIWLVAIAFVVDDCRVPKCPTALNVRQILFFSKSVILVI